MGKGGRFLSGTQALLILFAFNSQSNFKIQRCSLNKKLSQIPVNKKFVLKNWILKYDRQTSLDLAKQYYTVFYIITAQNKNTNFYFLKVFG